AAGAGATRRDRSSVNTTNASAYTAMAEYTAMSENESSVSASRFTDASLGQAYSVSVIVGIRRRQPRLVPLREVLDRGREPGILTACEPRVLHGGVAIAAVDDLHPQPPTRHEEARE